MTTINDVKTALNVVKEDYQIIADFEENMAKLAEEVKDLENKLDFDSVMTRKQKQDYLSEVSGKYNELVRQQFPAIRNHAHNIPVSHYIEEQLANNKELEAIKQHYNEAIDMLVTSAVTYNQKIKDIVKHAQDEIDETGYNDFIDVLNHNEVADRYGFGFVNNYANAFNSRRDMLSVPSEYEKLYQVKEQGE